MTFGPPPSPYTASADTARTARRRRMRLLGSVATAVVAALCVGAALLVHANDDDATPADSEPTAASQHPDDVRETVEKPPRTTSGRMAFRFSVDDMSPGERYEMPGMWATDKILAKSINRTLLGFEIGKDVVAGDEVWSVRLNGPICGTTPHVTADGRTAVLYRADSGEKALCDHVAFVDLDTGRKLWQKALPSTGTPHYAEIMPSVTLTRGTVAVTWSKGSSAYEMATGEELWKKRRTDGCRDTGSAGGKGLLIRDTCTADKTFDASFRIRKVDSRTGEVEWTYNVSKGVRSVFLISSEPVVLGIAAGDVDITDLITLDENGGYRATIRLGNGTYVADCADQTNYDTSDDCPSVVVGDGQVFLESREDPDQTAEANSNWIIGFDVVTGKTTRKFESGHNQLLHPLRMSGDQLLAYRESTDNIRPYGLVAIDPRTGRETPYFYFGLPIEATILATPKLVDVRVQNGRLFFGARAATGPGDGQQKRWEWLVLGIASVRPGT
ncbi:PQQ-binding-like beta-propeller repeat protein [Streptomyces sp. NPDC012510]|uniref:outer membrane protein assembly factor BamB family protein n=1 Tax=Streptomyces sp. NPDC012510 TaxID=3364838 RepID=UPI0036EE7F16